MIFSEMFLETCSEEIQEVALEAKALGEMEADFMKEVLEGEDSVRRTSGRKVKTTMQIFLSALMRHFTDVIRLLVCRNRGHKVRSLQIHVPAGMEDGKSIRLKGKGMPGSGGGEPGDLLLKVHVGQKAGFERKGADIYTTVNIPFTTAVFGGEVTVPTVDGRVVCKIREGTQSGSKIRLKGKGAVSMKNPTVHGDQYVTVQIQVPSPGQLSPEARQKLREYSQALSGREKSCGSSSAA